MFILLSLFLSTLPLLSFSFLSSADDENKGKKAIVIGASSGIGREVAKTLAHHGFELGMVGRRTHLLENLQQEISTKGYIKTIDISKTDEAITLLKELITEMGGLDLIVIMAGAYAQFDPNREWESTKKLIEVDVAGYSAMVFTAMEHFEKQKYGHLVGVTSIDALRGIPQAPSYSAAKGYASLLLEGMRNRMIQENLPIYVTELLPGWVDVEHTCFSQMPGTFWVASTKDAAAQIYDAIKAKKKRAYITKRWIFFAWFMKLAPDWLFNRLFKE